MTGDPLVDAEFYLALREAGISEAAARISVTRLTRVEDRLRALEFALQLKVRRDAERATSQRPHP